MLEAVLFDGDQTLWDFEKVMRQALSATLQELQASTVGAEALTVADLSADRNAVASELEGVEFNLARLRRLGFARTLQRLRPDHSLPPHDAAQLADQLTATYFHHRDLDPALFADAIPCLESLRGHYRLGLLSNGSRLPESIGLGQFFDVVVFAQDHRVAKPDLGIFTVAEQQLGLAAPHCVLVGDHRLNDVVGAKRAGWRAVWIDREGDGRYLPPNGCSEEPDGVIRSLSELGGLLQAW